MVDLGTLVGGRYRVTVELGPGPVGTRFDATDETGGGEVELELAGDDLVSDPDARVRFLREARRLARLEHPAIARILEVGEDTGPEGGPRVFLVKERLGGPTLAAHLARLGTLDPPRVGAVLAPLAAGLDHAHAQGAVHRDLRTATIAFDRAPDEGGVPRIRDFGLAVEVERTLGLTRPGAARMPPPGSLAYQAPEVFLGRSTRPSMDHWSLAVVAWELLVGRLPFPGPDSEVRRQVLEGDLVPPGLAPGIDAVLVRALDRDPGRRFPDARALVEALARRDASLGRPPAASPSPTSAPTSHRPPPREPASAPEAVVPPRAGPSASTSPEVGPEPAPEEESLSFFEKILALAMTLAGLGLTLAIGFPILSGAADVVAKVGYIGLHLGDPEALPREGNLCFKDLCFRTDTEKRHLAGRPGYTSESEAWFCPDHGPSGWFTDTKFDGAALTFYWMTVMSLAGGFLAACLALLARLAMAPVLVPLALAGVVPWGELLPHNEIDVMDAGGPASFKEAPAAISIVVAGVGTLACLAAYCWW